MEVVNRNDLEMQNMMAAKFTEEAEDDVFSVPDEEVEEEIENEEDEVGIRDKGIFRLHEAINIEGDMIKTLHFDFTKIKPVEYINIVKKVGKKESVNVPELNMSVQFNMFCRAAGMPVAILKNAVQRVDEFTAMCQLARDFLLARQGDSDEVL